MASSKSWKKIFDNYGILNHNFNVEPYILTAEQIKVACQDFKKTAEKEVRILCKQDSREDRPEIFAQNNLFILPVKNGEYAIIKGEGYVDIPEITTTIREYKSKLDFELESSLIGNSEMQHLDFAYASSLIRTFMGDDSLVLTIRGRKYTPQFSFNVETQTINVESVQTEVDAGYEGRHKIILVEAKNALTKNTIIRQLFYPFRQWKSQTTKEVLLVFFEKQNTVYNIWQYAFADENDYNSIALVKSSRYVII
jgi:deoxycytidine triphosphate deaminase